MSQLCIENLWQLWKKPGYRHTLLQLSQFFMKTVLYEMSYFCAKRILKTPYFFRKTYDTCVWCDNNCSWSRLRQLWLVLRQLWFFATIVVGCDNCEHCNNCDHKSVDNFFKNWHNDTFYAELPDMKLLWAKFLRVTSWDP